MGFEGHELYKIEENWVFDLTTFIGYHVEFDTKTDRIKCYTKAFIATYNNEMQAYGFEKYMAIPTRILRKAVNIIQTYRKQALLEDA